MHLPERQAFVLFGDVQEGEAKAHMAIDLPSDKPGEMAGLAFINAVERAATDHGVQVALVLGCPSQRDLELYKAARYEGAKVRLYVD